VTTPTAHRDTWTPDHAESYLDFIESNGIDYNDIHGYSPVFIVLASVLVVFWAGVVAAIVMAVTG